MAPCDESRPAGGAWLSLAGFLLLFAVLCTPWLSASRWALPEPDWSSRADNQLVVWILWWVSTALRESPAALFDAPINYPVPHQLTGSDHFLSSQILFSPLSWLLGNPIQATSLTLWLACFPLTAWAMSRLLAGLGLSPWACLSGALLYAFGPRQVPIGIHGLQVPLLFFPLAASSLQTLRSTPTLGHALVLALILLTGLLSSYYLAAMLLVVTAIWAGVQLASDVPGRVRFLTLGAAALASSLTVFVWFSLPYFKRDEVWTLTPDPTELVRIPRAIGVYVRQNPLVLFGGWLPVCLALVGSIAIRRPRTRWVAVGAAAIALAGFVLGSGVLTLLTDVPLPAAWKELLLIPARFFRVSLRLAGLVSFGTVLLAAIGIDHVVRAWPRAGTAAVVALIAYVLATGGVALHDTRMGPIMASPTDRIAYAEVGRLAREEGPGPLLELPLTSQGRPLQAEHMIGSIWHRQPLITGHTGYSPPQSLATLEQVRALPDEAALRRLMAQTGLRWILLRPRAGMGPLKQAAFVRALSTSGLATRVLTIGDWSLVHLREPTPP